ncbi:PIN domain-containing protein [candidate division KSB1 bacterium]|nr:PIN domain-containing protein [candidate division KSB1 bacterium]
MVDEFILSIEVIKTDIEILSKYGELKARLNEANNVLPDADILIAATALTKCTKLVTGNTKHFNRFENLNIDNWQV